MIPRTFLLRLVALALACIINANPITKGTDPIKTPTTWLSPNAGRLNFTFGRWIDDIVKNPNGTHLSYEQGAAAFVRGHDAAMRRENLPKRALDGLADFSRKTFQKRTTFKNSKRPGEATAGNQREGIDLSSVRCNTFPRNKAKVESIVECIEWLARSDKTCDTTWVKGFCQAGNNFILGWRKIDELSIHSPSCRGIARSAGRIMDFCTFDGQVMGETTAWDDPSMGVMIREFPEGRIPANFSLLASYER